VTTFVESVRLGLDKIWAGIGKTISTLVASAFIIFCLGSVFGFFVALRHLPMWTLMIPPLLGIIAYYYRTFAVILFILSLLIFWL